MLSARMLCRCLCHNYFCMQQYAILGRSVYSKVKFGLLKLWAFVHILDCQTFECYHDGVWHCGISHQMLHVSGCFIMSSGIPHI